MPHKKRKTGYAFIGTSGWNYPHWSKGIFYPAGLPSEEWLSYYARYFDTVEINNTFYQLPPPSVFQHWFEESPKHFIFAVKANRFITHMKKLKDPEQTVKRFLEHTARLKEKCGPILFQFPGSWRANPERLAGLIKYLSKQTILPGVRVVFEFRHPSWFDEHILRMIGEAGYSLCYADWPEEMLPGKEAVAKYVYLRRHGAGQLYGGCYSDEALKKDADLIKSLLQKGKDVYIYFNNDAHGWAVRNALTLKSLILT